MQTSNHTSDIAARQAVRDSLQADYEAFIRRRKVTVVPGYPDKPIPPREKIAKEPDPVKPSRAKGAPRNIKPWMRYHEMTDLARKHGITAPELARATGISRATIDCLMCGEYNPRPDRQTIIEAAILQLVSGREAIPDEVSETARKRIARTRGAHIPNGRARLAQMLDDNGITQRQVARAMNKPESYVSNVLSNRQAISAAMLAEMENVIVRIIESRKRDAAKMPISKMVICQEVE